MGIQNCTKNKNKNNGYTKSLKLKHIKIFIVKAFKLCIQMMNFVYLLNVKYTSIVLIINNFLCFKFIE